MALPRGSWADEERLPLLQDGSAASTYNAVDTDGFDRPLVSRGKGRLASNDANAPSRKGEGSSDLIVRIQGVCFAIHCPSCISHLQGLVSDLHINSASHTRVGDVSTSLIDRSVTFDLSISIGYLQAISKSAIGGSSPSRVASKLVTKTVKEIASILAQDGFPVDHLRSKLVSTTPSHRSYKDALTFVLDSAELYDHPAPHPSASSLPKGERHSTSVLGNFPASLGSTLRSALSRTSASDAARSQQDRWQAHLQICQACRGEVADGHSKDISPIDPEAREVRNGNQHASTDDAERRVVATLSISGMTCASCAQSITKALEAETSIPVDSIDINVMSASATVTTHPSAVDKVVEAIEDCGFDAQLVKTAPVRAKTVAVRETRDVHRSAKLSLQGMTCASCVQSIASALNSFANETNADHAVKILHTSVNLMAKSADIQLATQSTDSIGKAHVEKRIQAIVSEIGDIGFEAELLSLQHTKGNDSDGNESAGRSDENSDLQRSVRIKVDGMFCQHCIDKVRDYFHAKERDYASDLDLDEEDLEAFSLSKPFVNFSYVSAAESKIRLRDVLADINRLDPAFEASYSPPASLASRSAVMARKEMRDLLMRLSGAALFAVPTLVISMIAPMLPFDHPLRRYLSQYVVGSATRGEMAMWMISTPVQFGIGSVFFKKAWRSLASVWKRGRSWIDRLLRFGNMDVLVALGTLVAYTSSLAFLIIDALRPAPGQSIFRFSMSTTDHGDTSMPDEMGMTYFEASVFLVFFILLGRALESISKKKTGDAVADLGKMKPSNAYLVADPANMAQSKTEVVDVNMLEMQDFVLVPCGSSPPLDGSFAGIATGKQDAQALLDESSLSGEARPVSKSVGDPVYAGTINVSPTAIFVRIGVLPGSCLIDDILDVVQESAGKKASIAQLADKITGIFVPVIVYISLTVLLLWTTLLYSGALSEAWQAKHVPHYCEPGAKLLWALQFGISCLLVACPCGIGLAAPTSQLAGIGLASKHGILVNGGGEAFRAASAAARGSADLVVVFDKTGTITKGEAVSVTSSQFGSEAEGKDGLDQETLLRCIDLVEQSSTHSYAGAIRGFVTDRLGQADLNSSKDLPLPELVDVSEVAGKGIRASFKHETSSFVLLIGNRRLMDEIEGAHSRMDGSMKKAEQDWTAAANSVVYVGYQSTSKRDGRISLVLAVSDVIRPEASWVISHLKQRFGAEIWMVSGDNEATAKGVASQVGIDPSQVVAGVLPVQKKEWVERLQLPSSQRDLEHSSSQSPSKSWWRRRASTEPRMVCFIGDGINDSPALSSANLSIALGSGSSIAHSSSDFILLRRSSPLLSLPLLLSLSNATYLKIWTNFAWAFVFNLCLIPIAAGALIGFGIGLGPALSGLAMAFSSTSVVVNSLTLRWWAPDKVVRRKIEESEMEES